MIHLALTFFLPHMTHRNASCNVLEEHHYTQGQKVQTTEGSKTQRAKQTANQKAEFVGAAHRSPSDLILSNSLNILSLMNTPEPTHAHYTKEEHNGFA